MTRPGTAFMSDVSRRSWRPPIISGLASIASRTTTSGSAIAERGSSAGRVVGSASMA
jgi:hypothetical protein